MNSRNPQRKMSRLKLKKLKEDAKYNDQTRIDRNSYLLETERLKDDIKELEAKVLELDHELLTTATILKNRCITKDDTKDDIKELEAKVLELEHELYYERRNKRISEMYSEKE